MSEANDPRESRSHAAVQVGEEPGRTGARDTAHPDGDGPGAEETEETEEERAERLAREVAAENPDPTTRREAIEQALAEEGVSDEGEELGQHND